MQLLSDSQIMYDVLLQNQFIENMPPKQILITYI